MLKDVHTVWCDILLERLICDKLSNNQNTDKFLDYFVKTYFEGQFQINLWNHFETCCPRTNNNLEGYNLKLKKHVSAAHPNIYIVFKLIINKFL